MSYDLLPSPLRGEGWVRVAPARLAYFKERVMVGKRKEQVDLLESWGVYRVPQGHFLMKLDRMIKWYRIEKWLKRLYSEDQGRPSYPPVLLFKALLLAQYYQLSDPELEEQIKDRLSFQKFLGLSIEDAVPDETTFCRFRARLNEANLFERLFKEINHQLEVKGILLKNGSIVDASLIPSQNKKSDPEGKWTKREDKASFGYKLHISADSKHQLIQGVDLTPANVHDTKCLEDVIPVEAQRVYADKAYDNFKRRHQFKREGIYYGILTRSWQRELTMQEQQRNKRLSKIRGRVERVFAHLKCLYGYTHVRYRGLIRNKGHAYLLATAYNLKRAVALRAA